MSDKSPPPLADPPKKTPRSIQTIVLSAAGAILSIAYLMNPGAGFIEGLPDNIPIVGNIDEASATILLLYCLSNLGINILPGTKQFLKRDQREK